MNLTRYLFRPLQRLKHVPLRHIHTSRVLSGPTTYQSITLTRLSLLSLCVTVSFFGSGQDEKSRKSRRQQKAIHLTESHQIRQHPRADDVYADDRAVDRKASLNIHAIELKPATRTKHNNMHFFAERMSSNVHGPFCPAQYVGQPELHSLCVCVSINGYFRTSYQVLRHRIPFVFCCRQLCPQTTARDVIAGNPIKVCVLNVFCSMATPHSLD